MDSAALTDAVIVTYLNGGIFSCKFKVLRNSSDDSAGEDLAVLADAGTGEDSYVGANPGSVAYLHILTDGGKVGNFYVLANFGIRVKVV